MKYPSKIQHLYLYIPDLVHDDFQVAQQFLRKMAYEIHHITKQYDLALKTIYIANSTKAMPLLFLKKILLLLAPIVKNINQYSFETSIDTISNNILK
ncbi:hypothetical protein [Spiroplasma endosymbiont of Nebria brevicollis]|uniref:hypothetical protein n=1 Tax=Spiroplasma endosymbiont of Nebria brevicollis TaxID=3066284 RepID=UPI00313EC7A3